MLKIKHVSFNFTYTLYSIHISARSLDATYSFRLYDFQTSKGSPKYTSLELIKVEKGNGLFS